MTDPIGQKPAGGITSVSTQPGLNDLAVLAQIAANLAATIGEMRQNNPRFQDTEILKTALTHVTAAMVPALQGAFNLSSARLPH